MQIEDWDHWISHVDTMEDLSALEKERAKIALNIIREALGLDLQNLLKRGHPIAWDVINTTAWSRKRFIAVSEAIQMALEQKNGTEIIDKLKDPKMYVEALFELDTAYDLIKVGFDAEFYPRVSEINKVPDLKITNSETKEEFFVEITVLGASKQARVAAKTHNRITERLLHTRRTDDGKELLVMCRVHKFLSEPHLNEILLKIDEVILKAKRSGFAELVEDGVIDLALAKEEKRELLKAWSSSRKVEHFLSGPSWDADELHRTSVRIEEKQKQLPTNLLNILVIRDNTLFMFRRSVEEAMNRLEEIVFNFNHLAYCVIVEHYLGGEEDETQIRGDHLYLVRNSDVGTSKTLILTNKYITDRSITPNSASKIRQAFMQSRSIV